MPSYQQTGARTCPKCKTERTETHCKICGSKTRPSGKWSVRFRYKAGNELVLKRLSGYDTKSEAETAYYIFKNKSNEELSELAKLPFLALKVSYLQYKESRIRESSYIAYEQEIKHYLEPYFKDSNVFKLTKKNIVDWQNWLNEFRTSRGNKPLEHSKKQKCHERLISMLNYAVEFYNLPLNAAKQVKTFPNINPVKKEMLFWTETEFKTFIATVDEIEYKTLFAFLYLTGTRKGEALALTWQDINFDKKKVIISKSASVKTKTAAFKITAPKNFSSNREIYLPESLLELLKEYKAHCATYKNFRESCYLFGFNRPLPPETVRRNFNNYCDTAGVKRIRIHDQRHSHASLLINKGQNILAVAQRLGHSDIEQTLNTYSHFMPEEQKKLLEAISIDI